MTHWSPRQFLALGLAVFLALGVSLSAAQSGYMALQMATASAAASSGQGNCDGCASGDDGTDTVTCSPTLNCSSMAAVLPTERGGTATRPSKLNIPTAGMARDLTVPPDPDPPRSLDIV